MYSKCSKILNTNILNPSCLPKKACTKSVDPVQTAYEEAVWSGSSLFAIQTSILELPALVTNILFANRKRKVFKILEHLL